jgi:hypothetical protein
MNRVLADNFIMRAKYTRTIAFENNGRSSAAIRNMT